MLCTSTRVCPSSDEARNLVTTLGSGNGAIDHDLHGLVRIRIASAPSGFRERMRRRLGPPVEATDDEPDIRITFTDSLPTSGRLRFLGLNSAAYDEEHFYLLDDSGNRTRIDFSALGEPCELVCEGGIKSLPLLLPIASLRLLRKGHVLLHSSSFVYRDKGILVAGWQKGGKTEMLLAFMAAGAQFLGNEWTIVSPDEGQLRGVGGAIQVWDWQLRDLPQFWKRLPPADRQRLTLLHGYQSLYNAIPRRKDPRGVVGKALRQLSLEGGVSLLRQARTSPERLFGGSLWEGPAPLDRLFLATVGHRETVVLPARPQEVADRMLASQAYERGQLVAAYQCSRFAFPERRNQLLEQARAHELRILSEAFASKAAYEIVHPYPVSLKDLHRVAAPVCL